MDLILQLQGLLSTPAPVNCAAAGTAVGTQIKENMTRFVTSVTIANPNAAAKDVELWVGAILVPLTLRLKAFRLALNDTQDFPRNGARLLPAYAVARPTQNAVTAVVETDQLYAADDAVGAAAIMGVEYYDLW